MPKRSSIKITKSTVDGLKLGQAVWDAQIPGFGIIANKHSKTYKLKYYYRGLQRMLTIGQHGTLTVDQARNLAIGFKAQIVDGADPAVEKQRSGFSVKDLCDEYRTKYAEVKKKAGSAAEDAANIRNHVIPLLGKLPVSEVNSGDIERFKLDVAKGKTAPDDPKAVQKKQRGGSPVKGGQGVANRCLALLSKMFNLAEQWGYRDQQTNPVRGVAKYRERSLERFLSEGELQRLWEHLDSLDADENSGWTYPVAMIRLLLLTGARCGEIQTLKWSMVDLKASRLNLPDSKTGSKPIQLSSQAVEILEKLPRVKNNPYVIVGSKDEKHLKNIRKPWVAIRSKVGLDDVRIHDLRHSFASLAAAQGIDLLTIGKLLGHKNATTTQRYAHLTEAHVAKANQQVGNALRKVRPQADAEVEADR